MRKQGDQILHGITVQTATGCGNAYIVLNADDKGKLSELFASLGKSGTCVRHWMEVTGRIVSLLIRSDTDIKRMIKTLKGIQCQESVSDRSSCADALAFALEKFLEAKLEDKVEDKKDDVVQVRTSDEGVII